MVNAVVTPFRDDPESTVQRPELSEDYIERLLSNSERWYALRNVAPALIAPVLRRLIDRDGSFPANSKLECDREDIVIGPAITRDAEGTYSVHNCCFFVLSKDGVGRKRSRHSLDLAEAVRLFLIAEPFGNNRGYAWAPQYWPSRESG